MDVELPDGERVWEHVVRLPQAALMALLDDQRRVLLVWRHRFVPDMWGWELPGGQVDEDEDPAEAAAREAGGHHWVPSGPRGAPDHVSATA